VYSTRTTYDLDEEGGRLPDSNVFLPLGLRQGAGHLVDEDCRGEQFNGISPVFVAQSDGFRRERPRDDPAERDGDVEHVLHTSSS
jgi:hypothetical protein